MAGSKPRCAAHSQAHKAESFALDGSPMERSCPQATWAHRTKCQGKMFDSGVGAFSGVGDETEERRRRKGLGRHSGLTEGTGVSSEDNEVSVTEAWEE